MAIRRSYSPPFLAPSPQPGADDMGRAVKGLVSVEVNRSNEISFAVESFGCDGKPVLSLLRDLPCDSTGDLVVAGTKNGMPFKLGSELPRSLGSAIRGAGGTLRRVDAGAGLRTREWVIYDNFGNHWSLDVLISGRPTYLGETPREINSNDSTPALCTQAPRIRPYELRWEYANPAGEGGDPQVQYYWGGAGWSEDVFGASPVLASPVAYPYVTPASYYRVEQWIPDETTAPAGGELAGAWPTSKRRVTCQWYPGAVDEPHDYDAETGNSCDVIVSKYPATAPWKVEMNEWTRPSLEHISTGGRAEEAEFVICVERNLLTPPYSRRIALRGRNTGTLLATTGTGVPADDRAMFTPMVGEGWLRQTGIITGGDSVQVLWFKSRASTVAAWGSSLTYAGQRNMVLPSDAAHPWTSEPVWFRVGRVHRTLGSPDVVAPLLPRWR